ncbi:2Fe-2S iron-sulfur cluster-binding protein [Chitiniphilus purpureus]|uniref:2Fe-2S iron-sulfur cluster-binding protein n=1 Tax=Chitiniphilus purpureus TaxID=2981137 RepID=A0ABY6DWE7_9NEIS|nr:2Fe-2S iron-sulfur cluster-binding protein [Chitiniphilus sp. CD1]UXY16168.1 2Fe-2S iron-sulfur cluster-binding protein [Chitiniphilus sp. CD1]
MPVLTFMVDQQLVLQTEVPQATRLIDVIRHNAGVFVPALPWRCGQGSCGACVVFIAPDASQALPCPRLEQAVLARRGLDPVASSATLPHVPRLACHIQVASDLTIYIHKE